jgi:hypothetical protein
LCVECHHDVQGCFLELASEHDGGDPCGGRRHTLIDDRLKRASLLLQHRPDLAEPGS